jgi:hypothetical protein
MLPPHPRPERAGLAAAALVALAMGGGCRERATSYDCACTYLTDFDDASKQAVSVCAPSPERAPDVARGCAQASAPAPVQTCECRSAGGPACEGAGCRAAR